MRAVSVSTTEFQFAHGKMPSGWGCWAFFFPGQRDPEWFTGTWGAARKWAVARARERGDNRVAVGS